MGVTVQQESGNVWTLRITGALRKAELDTVQASAAKLLGAAAKAKVLIVAEEFSGWERGADWGDMTFFLEHGDQIEKIAIVADQKWEAQFLMFAGAGFRRAPVKFFPENQLAEARAWLD
jgi:hypothetical protein